MTGEDNTIFSFDVADKMLDEALDIFKQFFICPLFKEQSLENEINTIETEFTKNISNQDRAIMQLVKSFVVNENCRLNRFGTGNKQSLTVVNNYETVRQFYDDNYSSNLMSLCVAAN